MSAFYGVAYELEHLLVVDRHRSRYLLLHSFHLPWKGEIVPTSRPTGFQLTRSGKLRLYNTKELLELPPPEWLVENHLPQGGLVGLYGPPGKGKSFAAIDLAMAVACGRPWQGHAVRKGYVIYIAAEGGVGITKRVRAWLAYHKVNASSANIAWLTESVAVNNDAEDLTNLFARIDDEIQEVPALIIIDTLARCFDGNENEQEDMGRFIAGVDRMRLGYGATVVIIHHTNVSGGRERGNTAFRGAADTMLAVDQSEKSGAITIECNKQKDAADFETIEVALHVMPEYESCVLVKAEQTKADIVRQWLTIGPMTFSEMKTRALEQGSRISLATLKRQLRELIQNEEILKENGQYIDSGIILGSIGSPS